jgi:hypothetical protein
MCGGYDRVAIQQPTYWSASVTFIVIFTAGYLIGGISALFILGLTVAARHADREHATSTPVEKHV